MRALIFLVFFMINLNAYKNVLILNSYSIKFAWTKTELEGILNQINDRKDLKIYIEFMDTKVFRPTVIRLANFYDYLKNKYQNKKFDIVITTDDNALNFIRKYKETYLFNKSKIFFAGVNNLELAKVLDKKVFAGVFEKKEPLVNLKFIKKIDPKIDTIYVIADNSNSAKSVMKEYKNAYKNIKNIKFIYINEKNLDNVLEQIKLYSKHSAMMLLTPFSFCLNSRHINYKYSIVLISQYFNKPIVIHTDLLANIEKTNIVGGKVTDAFSQGREVAKKVIDYLNGKDMKSIGFTFEKANKMYLNVKNLNKFGVNAYKLNFDNVVYVNKPNSFFEIYKEWIISFGVLFFTIVVIVIILFIKNVQLKKYNSKIKNMNKTLEDKIQAAIDEIKKRDKEISLYKEEAFRRIINGIIFQLKYPIKKLETLDINNEAKEMVEFLSNKIDEFEKIFVNDEKVNFSVKNSIEYIVSLVKPYFDSYNIKIKIIGDDFYINANRVMFEQMFINFLKGTKIFFEENGIESPEINIILDSKTKTIKIEETIFGLKREFFEKIMDSTMVKQISKPHSFGVYFSKIVLENFLNGTISLENYKNNVIFKITLL
ncbi:hypothetical protein JCM11957_02870 [Caminibacter profundus]